RAGQRHLVDGRQQFIVVRLVVFIGEQRVPLVRFDGDRAAGLHRLGRVRGGDWGHRRDRQRRCRRNFRSVHRGVQGTEVIIARSRRGNPVGEAARRGGAAGRLRRGLYVRRAQKAARQKEQQNQ